MEGKRRDGAAAPPGGTKRGFSGRFGKDVTFE